MNREAFEIELLRRGFKFMGAEPDKGSWSNGHFTVEVGGKPGPNTFAAMLRDIDAALERGSP